jgi:hypothetical protein
VSVLNFPRINIRGQFRTNPCTANNDDVMPDVVTRDSCELGSNLSGMTDDQILAYLRETVTMSNATGDPCTRFIRSGWNLYGNHWTNFQNTSVSSVVVGPNASQRYSTPQQDPLIGESFTLLGSLGDGTMRRGDPVLVDVDPTGLVTTQLWLGGIQLQDPNGILQINADTRCFQNWLNFFSTVPSTQYGTYQGEQNFVGIGCTMQFGIPASAIPSNLSWIGSPVLKQLLTFAQQQQGLVVRFRIWEVEPYLTDEQLAAYYSQGQGASNYAYGYMIGTIGVWLPGEPATEVPGRKLIAPYKIYQGYSRPAMSYAPPDGSGPPLTIPQADVPWGNPPALIGNIVANVISDGANFVSLDMSGAFPKYGFRDPQGPSTPTAQGFDAPVAMANVGTLGLYLVNSAGDTLVTVAENIDYGLQDSDDWMNFGGIVDVQYPSIITPDLYEFDLALKGTTSSSLNPGTTLLAEQNPRVMTDDRGVYLPYGNTQDVSLMVTVRGYPPPSDVTVYLYEYLNIIQEQPGGTCTDGNRPNQTTDVRITYDPPNRLYFPATVTYPANQGGWVAVPITGMNGGAAILNYQTFTGTMGDSVPAWSTMTYSTVRVFMDDDYSSVINSGNIPWDFVYENALRYYYVIFPAMSMFIPLNSPDSVLRAAPMIQQRLSTPGTTMFNSTYNMPVTRTMSPGKVQLILAWLAQEQAKQGAQAQATVKKPARKPRLTKGKGKPRKRTPAKA